MHIGSILKRMAILTACVLMLNQSVFTPKELTDRVSRYTGGIEFDYFKWTVDSFVLKIGETGIAPVDHLNKDVQHRIVVKYFDLVRQLNELDGKIAQIYADPSVKDPEKTAADDLRLQSQTQAMANSLAPIAEEILQAQVTTILNEEGLSLGGQPIPSVLYHTSPLPKALIVSPRGAIQQEVNISLLADLSLEQITQLEKRVETNLNVSALVVDIGGVGVYPTMVMRSSDLNWVISTVAHEWTHNFLTFRPLGWNYDTTAELRTMNETSASIAGNEIGARVIARYYPELNPAGYIPSKSLGLLVSTYFDAPTFDFNHEMHQTRVTVDELLKAGKITEAEAYMEQQRQVFVAHGYMIRKLNQAYFAFYGAYADTPGGAAGEDPVGPAVRELRQQSASLADFLNKISWMTTFDQLKTAVN